MTEHPLPPHVFAGRFDGSLVLFWLLNRSVILGGRECIDGRLNRESMFGFKAICRECADSYKVIFHA
jgi:hypothetical protein